MNESVHTHLPRPPVSFLFYIARTYNAHDEFLRMCVFVCIIALSHATTTTIAIMIVLLFTVCFDFILNSTVISNDRSENFS